MIRNFNYLILVTILPIFKFNSNNVNDFTYINNNKNSKFLNLRNLRNLEHFNNKNTKKNLIIGAIINYSWSKIKLYFISLIKAKFENYDFVLYVGGISNRTIKRIESCGVITYQIPKDIFKLRTTINNFRWKLYKDFLLENKDKYNMVFTADVRDTIFQKDVFQFYDSSKSFLGVFFEDGDMRVKANRIWVLKFCNESEFNEIINETVICSGTLIGTVDKFLEFSQELWYTVKNKKRVVDQGAANYLIHFKKRFNDCLIKGDNHGFVMTIGLTNKNKVILDKDDNILNFEGKIAAVVHQYDRKHDIVDKLKKKFNDSFIVNDDLIINDEKNFINEMVKSKIKAKYYISIVFVFMIIIYLIHLLRKKKKQKNLRSFKKVKLKVFKQKEKSKKLNLLKYSYNYHLIPQDKT